MTGSGFGQLEHGGHVLGPLEHPGVELDVLGGEECAVQQKENSLGRHRDLLHQSRHRLVHRSLQVPLQLNL